MSSYGEVYVCLMYAKNLIVASCDSGSCFINGFDPRGHRVCLFNLIIASCDSVQFHYNGFVPRVNCSIYF